MRTSLTKRYVVRTKQRRRSEWRRMRWVKALILSGQSIRDPLDHTKWSTKRKIVVSGSYLACAIGLHLALTAISFSFKQENHNAMIPKNIVEKVAFNVVKTVKAPTVSKPELPKEAIVEEPPKQISAKKTTAKTSAQEVLKADLVDLEPESTPDLTPKRRIVGISLESTVSGNNPIFAVGNTRMGITDTKASDPLGIEKIRPGSGNTVSKLGNDLSNQKASFIPEDGVLFEKPKRLREVQLDYPATLKTRGIEGNVVVLITIGEQGKVLSVKIIKSSGFEELDQVAKQAASKENFSPAKRNGQPIAYDLKYTYRFRIKTS